MSIFGATDIPLLVTSPLGFKARVVALFALGRGVLDTHPQRFISGATSLPVYIVSIVSGCFPHMHVSAEVGCWTPMGDLPLSSLTHLPQGHSDCLKYAHLVVADPGFPQGGSANSRGGANIWFCLNFPKLHEIESIWIPRGHEGRAPPLDPPLLSTVQSITQRLVHAIAIT